MPTLNEISHDNLIGLMCKLNPKNAFALAQVNKNFFSLWNSELHWKRRLQEITDMQNIETPGLSCKIIFKEIHALSKIDRSLEIFQIILKDEVKAILVVRTPILLQKLGQYDERKLEQQEMDTPCYGEPPSPESEVMRPINGGYLQELSMAHLEFFNYLMAKFPEKLSEEQKKIIQEHHDDQKNKQENSRDSLAC